LPGFVRHLKACNAHDLEKFQVFRVAGKPVGWVKKPIAAMLADKLPADFDQSPDGLSVKPQGFDAATESLSRATELLCAHYGAKQRNEKYAVFEKWGAGDLAAIDRIAVPWFGTRGCGVHVNGYVRKSDGLYIWVAERAMDRLIDPGKLDNMIGGGVPIGLSLDKNLVKESYEEAGFDEKTALAAKPVGSISYRLEMMKGLRNDTLFIYDLELPEGVAPRNTDGEVGTFRLLPASEVAEIIATTDRFKFNCNVVITDFLMRMGALPKDHPEGASIDEWLRKMRQAPF
jgi:8-oxo-dGTP pyrophosphatase MutT (NUDIX family)